MAKLVADPARYLRQQLDRKSRVLLINPPVQERRYHWLRWNQPAELLKLSSWLKGEFRGIDVRIFDFMLPNETGDVPKHKVKETWRGPDDRQLWHFGESFEAFEASVSRWVLKEGWSPDVIVVSSLTSYWHTSIEKLLIKLCMRLPKAERRRVKICLYGNYPRFEPDHASAQRDADVAMTRTLDTRGLMPDFGLYPKDHSRSPLFFGLDIEDPEVDEHLNVCLEYQEAWQKKRGITRSPTITVAFLNDDVCSKVSCLERVVEFARRRPGQVIIEGIAGIEPRSLTRENLVKLKAAGFRSLFVEHARAPGGDLEVDAYEPLREFLREEARSKKAGTSQNAWLERGNVTGFVAMGLPDDEIDALVRSTLKINSFFQSVILKPYGYSSSIDRSNYEERRARWQQPYASSPQWFPYVGSGALRSADYDNLLRWQNVLNKRVKGATFDFLGPGSVARMVRDTLVAESWKRRREAR